MDVKVRARFFADADCPWLEPLSTSLTLPPGGSALLSARITVPATQPYGSYGAKLLLSPRGAPATQTIVLPVGINVAGALSEAPIALGGGSGEPTPFDNYRVRGDFSWNDRSESGDGRLYFIDVSAASPGRMWLTRTAWQDSVPTDVDTLIFGPQPDGFSTPGDSYYLPVYGPNTLAPVGGERSPGRPDWRFRTTSGGTVDYAVGPMSAGLHAFFLHNILFSGEVFDVPLRVDVGALDVAPYPLSFRSTTSSLVGAVTLTSSLALPDLSVTVYGPTRVQTFRNQPIATRVIGSVQPNWFHRFQTSGIGRIDLETFAASPATHDIDLYLYRDGADGTNPDGQFRYPQEVVASSIGFDAHERITLSLPPDGDYLAGIYGFTVDDVGYFDFAVRNAQGTGLIEVSPAVLGNLAPGTPKSFQINAPLGQPGDYTGYMLIGPAESPHAAGFSLPLAFFLAGDADGSGVVDARDYLTWPRHWHAEHLVPAGLDVNGDGVFNADDAVRLIAPVSGKPGPKAR
ncbi:hypothetical protein HS125_07770 [bacterium]|nr:hypothetical protein [bacterium]